jgi:hypothetical protein
MSFNRLKYDKCETKQYNGQSIGPGKYQMDTPIQCNLCLNDNPWIQNQKMGVSVNSHVDWRFYSGPIDVESDLFNLNRPSNRCVADKYSPRCDTNGCSTGEPCGQGVSVGCNESGLRNPWNRPGDNNLVNFPRCHFPVDDTRLNNPASNLRGTGWNRFDILMWNPQNNVFFPGEQNVCTQTVVKDNHRPLVVQPHVNNMDPKSKPLPNIMTNNVPANYTAPLYQYDVCG